MSGSDFLAENELEEEKYYFENETSVCYIKHQQYNLCAY